ncbi:neurofilament heavy polypeptide isoform X2 [Sebastes umbrosus]|uniref:neurofilament heavy polypeptide isoform X2 n=1 Tax=Sebastes umbrosus TaxID=72105 RepID=UPI00189C6F00|nr:neurofilament heavy polypeptide isoform X2 [Sebastes umbrosus]
MKVQCILPMTIVVTVAMIGIVKIREKEHLKETKRSKFQDIKLRVTYDVLQEYNKEKAETQDLLVKTQIEEKTMGEEVNKLQNRAEEARGDADICKSSQKSQKDELALAETELKNLQDELDKEKASWEKESETLKQQLAARSAVCGFLKTKSDAVSKLCGDDVIVADAKQEEAKPEAPKQEEAKPEAPKKEEAKPEAPKKEEAKPEAPKQEEAKPEAPKQEAPKAEAPKKR